MKLAVAAVATVLSFSFAASVAEAKGAKNRKSASFATTNYAPSGSATSSNVSVGSTKRETYRPDDRAGGIGVAASVGMLYYDVGYGVDLWYMASKKLQLGIQVNHVATEIDSRKQSGETSFLNEYLNMELTGFKSQARYFVWNSLFVSGGASYNVVEGEYGFLFGDTSDHSGRKFSATMAMAHVGLGNQWKLNNGLILGGEWIGAAGHLMTQVKDKGDASVYSEASGTQESETEYDDAAFKAKVKSKLENQIQFSLAMLTLGYEF